LRWEAFNQRIRAKLLRAAGLGEEEEEDE
jgi:hypothetical protein